MSSDAMQISDAAERDGKKAHAQDLPPGYKRTEVGVIPEDWRVMTLSELGHSLSGGTPSKSDSQLWSGDIPWVSSKDMKVARIRDSIDHVSRLALGNGTRLVQPGTILMVVRGMSLAHSFPVAIVEAPVAFNQDIKAFVPNSEVSGEFVLRWLESSQAAVLLLATEATHGTKRLPTGDLLGSMIPLPRPAEQHAIAEALSDMDGLLGALEALTVKKRAIKQATMQQLLTGKTRLPGFSEEWEVKRLCDIVSTPISDGPHLTPKFLSDGIPFLSVNNLIDNKLDLTSLRFISRADHEEFARKCRPRKGDILFGKAASVGQVALIDTDIELNIWSPLALIRVGDQVSAQFAVFALQAHDVHRQIELFTNSSSQGNIGMSDIGRIAIPVPAPAEQTAIASVISDIDAEIAALERRRDKIHAIKQGMMQQLLTGRVRLVTPEAA